MEDIDGYKEGDEEEAMVIDRPVALFISPGLYRRGDADGEHYGIESCLVKTQVQRLDHGMVPGRLRLAMLPTLTGHEAKSPYLAIGCTSAAVSSL